MTDFTSQPAEMGFWEQACGLCGYPGLPPAHGPVAEADAEPAAFAFPTGAAPWAAGEALAA
jgi:hypothetical protein